MAPESPELSVADRLENEIANLRDQVESLNKQLKLQTTTLLTADSTRKIIESRQEIDKIESLSSKLLAQSDKQVAHNQQCLYRACASITTFKVRDPDPNAVNGGNVFGLRFEVMSKSKFVRPYYVMLNRPYLNSRHLRVHRHTVPPCIPLPGLAARHLPPLKPSEGDNEVEKQDLSRFARALRRELVRYHNRAAVISDLRKSVGIGSQKGKRKGVDNPISDISAADAEAKQVRIEWNDGKTGRLVMNDDGDVQKMVVQGENGRDRQVVRDFLGETVRIEELVQRLDAP